MKLSNTDTIEIQKLYDKGLRPEYIAKMYRQQPNVIRSKLTCGRWYYTEPNPEPNPFRYEYKNHYQEIYELQQEKQNGKNKQQ